MLVEHYREKLLSSITYFLKHTKYCGKTKLFKLLYYLDFIHFRETGKSVTGLEYYAWSFGPVPTKLFFEFKSPQLDLAKTVHIPNTTDNSFTDLKAIKKFDDKYFTKRELRILKEVTYIFKEAKADDMVEASHLHNHPWDKTIKERGEKQKIDYLLAIDGSKGSLDIDEILERVEDRKAIKKAFR